MAEKMIAATVLAPAKINLCLHITGQRDDGYHMLDSLVVFASISDTLRIQIGNTRSLTVEGPEADGVPADMANLVMKVAALFEDQPGASFLLTKHLPAAAGIGGGSADAAAAFRGLVAHWSGGVADSEIYVPSRTPMGPKLAGLGADIPMCLQSRPVRVTGVGEVLDPVAMPPLPALLVNPRVPIATPKVFADLAHKSNPPLPAHVPSFAGPNHVIEWLADQRNDLEPPALRLAPVIGDLLDVLHHFPTCRLARMSGSGATCFGLFDSYAAAQEAEAYVRKQHPGWWAHAVWLGDYAHAVIPKIERSATAAFS